MIKVQAGFFPRSVPTPFIFFGYAGRFAALLCGLSLTVLLGGALFRLALFRGTLLDVGPRLRRGTMGWNVSHMRPRLLRWVLWLRRWRSAFLPLSLRGSRK
ncbi:MAG TPA: hypothetical protein VH639_15445 [Bryobacteraceae bacterium]|jgi:hypothetical protein